MFPEKSNEKCILCEKKSGSNGSFRSKISLNLLQLFKEKATQQRIKNSYCVSIFFRD